MTKKYAQEIGFEIWDATIRLNEPQKPQVVPENELQK